MSNQSLRAFVPAQWKEIQMQCTLVYKAVSKRGKSAELVLRSGADFRKGKVFQLMFAKIRPKIESQMRPPQHQHANTVVVKFPSTPCFVGLTKDFSGLSMASIWELFTLQSPPCYGFLLYCPEWSAPKVALPQNLFTLFLVPSGVPSSSPCWDGPRSD